MKRACTELNEGGTYTDNLFSIMMDSTEVQLFEERFQKALDTIGAKGYGCIDILVNNAGVLGASMPNATEEEFDKVIDTNLKGVFFLSQLVGKYMKENKIEGNILNVGSSSSLRPAISAYTLSKWGIRGLTLGLAKALAPYGITVNGIAPGPTMTPMLLQDYGLSTPPQFVKKSYRPLCLSGRDRQYGSGAGERYGQDHCGRHGIYDGRRGCHNLRRRRVHFLNPAERYVDVPVEAGHMIHV